MAIPQPGVTVIQEISTVSPTIAAATLPACVVGPAFEVIEILNTDGTLNIDARAGTYSQFLLQVLQGSFPNPRGNILQLDILEDEVRVFLYYGNELHELPRGDGAPNGTAFLQLTADLTTAASFVSTNAEGAWALALGDTLSISIDGAAPVVVSLPAAGDVVAVAAAINGAIGDTVAGPAADVTRLQVTSPLFGALSSIVVGATAGAIKLNGVGAGQTWTVTGAGFLPDDDLDGDLTTPWITYSQGEADDSGVGGLGNWGVSPVGMCQLMIVAPDEPLFGYTTGQTFLGPGATLPLQASTATSAGDVMYAEGAAVLGGEVLEVQPARFRLGVLNGALSTFDSTGTPTTRVYDAAEVNLLTHNSPFAPNWTWFQAQGLQVGSGFPPPTAGVLTSTNSGSPARTAHIQGQIVGNIGPFLINGLVLRVGLRDDGVALPAVDLTFSSEPANPGALLTEVQTQINASPYNGLILVRQFSDGADTWLGLETVKTGSGQFIGVPPGGTANAALGYAAGAGDPGTDSQMSAQAEVTGAVIAPAVAALNGATITMAVVDSRGTHNTAYTMGPAEAGAVSDTAIAVLLNAQAAQSAWDGTIRIGSWSGHAIGDRMIFNSVGQGAGVTIDIVAAGGDGGSFLGFTDALDAENAANDGLRGSTLQWNLNLNECTFTATFTSNSMDDAADAINLLHDGNIVATVSGGNNLVLASPLEGIASEVFIPGGTAQAMLGFAVGANDVANGSGRPNPDYFQGLSGDLNLGAEILRNSLTGQPFCPASASLYISHRALRLDVTQQATGVVEKLLTIEDNTVLAAALAPLTDENPLGLGMFLALLNSPTVAVTGLGVDEVTAARMEGTLDGYARALDYLEGKDIYAMAPLTDDELVHQVFAVHVSAMSEPDQRGERIVFIAPQDPEEAFPTAISSGECNSTATSNELVLDSNPTAALVADGLVPAALTVANGVYLEITIGGQFRRYNVSSAAATLAVLNPGPFAAGDNDDGFYTTTTLTEAVIDGDFALKVRGNPLVVPGTAPPLPDLAGRAAAVADLSESYGNRRVFRLFPDTVTTELDTGTVVLPSYFAGAAIAGMVGQQSPSQPFTNLPMAGFTDVQGSDDTYKPAHLDTMAGGGTYILYQPADGGPVMCRHQLATDTTTVERRELSITKAVDFVAKFLRNALRNFIGKFNITPAFLDSVATVVQGQLAFLGGDGMGVIARGTLNNIIQDETNPDTILVDVTLEVLYPCNYIRVTLVV